MSAGPAAAQTYIGFLSCCGWCFAHSRAPTNLRRLRKFSEAIFFLSPRRRSGERIEERGSLGLRQTNLLSPPLSSIRWRRGSVWLPRQPRWVYLRL